MKNRFDLEQDIMECWRVVDDIEHGNARILKEYYDMKFEKLWDTFLQVFQIDDYAPSQQETTDEN